MEITDQHRKTLTQIKLLQSMNLPKEHLEATLITLLQFIYSDDEMKVLGYIENLGNLKG